MYTALVAGGSRTKRQWREYRTEGGGRPIHGFLMALDTDDRATVVAAMKDVQLRGLAAARHLHEDIYEVRASGRDNIYRVLFATEGRFSQVLLSLEAFTKKSQKTPPAKIRLAERRLADWRARGIAAKKPVKSALKKSGLRKG